MPKYICTDGNAEIEITAETSQAAAQEYVDSGDWDREQTDWVDVYVRRDVSDIDERMTALIGDHEVTQHDTGWWVYAARDLDIDALRAALPECTLRLVDGSLRDDPLARRDLDIDHGFYRERITIEIEAEPDCEAEEHDWQSPYEVVGGVKENPGVRGHGGGVIIKECCAHCGRYRFTDTWAQRRDTGEQGLRRVSYEDADEVSREWMAGGDSKAYVIEGWRLTPASTT
jgi:hypothetical protein